MGFGNNVTIVGNVARDPELRYTPSGASVASFGVAWNRKYTRNGEQVEETSFFDVSCWGTLADNVSASITKGTRVVVVGEMRQQSWETPQGEKRSKIEITADEVSPSLRWAACQVQRNQRDDNGGGGGQQQQARPAQAQPAQAQAAKPQADFNYDEEPF
jgi:single-strand DNA-binding protein